MSGAYSCQMKWKELGVFRSQDAKWVHGILEVRCLNAKPRSHHLLMDLQRWPYEGRRPPRQSPWGDWEQKQRSRSMIVPGRTGRKFVVAHDRCESGTWRALAVVTGVAADGNEYRSSPKGEYYEARAKIECD
ncbi:hypothetical protein [Actinomadura sp. NBRC 104425]|uniref:hypothetical protein n=1 Tax=Actinomadura sp. NBRC 104425 TaxID=3032204 RepID=UPI0025562128|nr:hypothetical protein [Actinomadura sp. NBRC 104425]